MDNFNITFGQLVKYIISCDGPVYDYDNITFFDILSYLETYSLAELLDANEYIETKEGEPSQRFFIQHENDCISFSKIPNDATYFKINSDSKLNNCIISFEYEYTFNDMKKFFANNS